MTEAQSESLPSSGSLEGDTSVTSTQFSYDPASTNEAVTVIVSKPLTASMGSVQFMVLNPSNGVPLEVVILPMTISSGNSSKMVISVAARSPMFSTVTVKTKLVPEPLASQLLPVF